MDFDEVWERICLKTGWKKYGEMGEFLCIKSSSMSGAKARGSFPMEWAFKIAQGFNLSTDWLLTGKMPGEIEPIAIDEGFFTYVLCAVDAALEEQKIDLDLFKRIKLYIFLYNNCMDDRKVSRKMLEETIELARRDTFLVRSDSEVKELVGKIVEFKFRKGEQLSKPLLFAEWWEKIDKKFNVVRLYLPIKDKNTLISWLREELAAEEKG